MKKLLLTLGAAGATLAPLATVVACGTEDVATTTEADSAAMKTSRAVIEQGLLPVTGSDDWLGIQEYLMGMLTEVGLGPEIHQFKYNTVTAPDDHDHEDDDHYMGVDQYRHPAHHAHNSNAALKYNTYWQENVDKLRPVDEQEWDYEKNQVKVVDENDEGYLTGLIGRNIVVEVEGTDAVLKDKVVTVGAHYDLFHTYAETGSDGFQDNILGYSTVIELAKAAKENPQPHTQRFVLFDVEENGLEGSFQYAQIAAGNVEDEHGTKYYYKHLNEDGSWGEDVDYGLLEDQVLYINLDSFAGGDNIVLGRGLGQSHQGDGGVLNEYEMMSHIGSSLYGGTFELPYYMEWSSADYWDHYSLDDMFNSDGTYNEHPSTYVFDHPTETELGIGEHQQGDHRYLVNEGIPSLLFESSNYKLAGQYGRDGYSQVDHEDFWAPNPDALEDGTVTAEQAEIGIVGGPYGIQGVNEGGYAREHEYIWGKIWHNNFGYDKLSFLEDAFGSRIVEQTNTVFNTVKHFLENYKPS